jgi:hypothetical protein
MTTLTTSTFTGILPYVPTPPAPTPPTFTMPDPISYEFQVVEYMEDEKITKVALQVKQNLHDQYGNVKLHGTWQDVPRIKVKL